MSKNYSCGTLLKQIHDILERNANNVLREQDLTISQSGVLVLLDEKEGKTALFKELEKDFGVSQPTMVGILNRLEQKDLVEVLTDPEDKRIRKAHLTQKGADKCEEGYKCSSGVKTVCPDGKYSNEGSSSCTNCEAGYACKNGNKT